ncbi:MULTISPECIES: EAL domain-containing protein [Citrobacter]|uniref:EAL domain-containing protein n=1 Tax=Citrobacter TaxID=544 RepID=UPI001D067AC0|nr:MULTISPECIES: EAL domain-containing protein [Citrobacter]MCB6779467.1 EAL domain-containing protein [Citrobacter sp. 210820-DFI.7.8]MCB6789167.1 EAL domain-containing protein [Citrobacter sp. 210820-DFI.7.7]MCB8603599.1 EAL domain-containing protein [Citrobacter europaeus]MCQ5007032.1 EAL domain-containing protein [Citrobacter europaeus]
MITITRQLPTLFSDASGLLARFLTCAPVKALKTAIAHRQFRPVYQPIFNSQTGKIAGIEVLARWTHPQYGTIPPDVFIPLAEEQGLIASLTHHLIQQVIADLQPRLPLFPKGLYLNLNLSPENCLDPRFESDAVALMQKLAPGQVQLVIEITERRPLHFTPQLSEWFASLRKSNIAVALDDFGTGYSNLCYLHALEPEFIKIDKLFVGQIGEGGDTRIIDTLIELAQKMNLRMIAEGVETRAQADYLRVKRCDFLQGYYFCRPVPLEELIGVMQSPAIFSVD